jgi:hypothetical protein
MVKTEAEKGSSVGFLKHVARKLTVAALSPTIFRSETIDDNHSVNKAKEILGGGNGLIIVINHFSLRDPPQAVNEIFHHAVMNSKKIITPIAYHMDKDMYHWLGKIIDVVLKPIVTKSTINEGTPNDRELNDGMKEYFDESMELLKKGGIVVLTPQGTRLPHLGQPDNPTIGTFMATANKNGLDRYAFLFIGFGIKGADDYSDKKIKGLNLSRKYTVNIGTCLTREEILAEAQAEAEKTENATKKPRNPFRFVDKVVYEELRKVVPPNLR